jgi:hypothetical protein
MFWTTDVQASAYGGLFFGVVSFIKPVRKLVGEKISPAAEKSFGWVGAGLGLLTVANIAFRYLRLHFKIRSNIRDEFTPGPDVRKQPYFKDAELIAKGPKNLYDDGPIFQPVEGYCGHASILSVLHSAGVKPLPALPGTPEPMDMCHVAAVLRKFFPADAVETFSAPMTFDEFKKHVELSGDAARYRYVMNYLRTPLFFVDPANPDAEAGTLGKFFSGHFSVIAGTVRDTAKYGDVTLVVLHDVNRKYGSCLVPLEQLYRCVNTRSLIDGVERGFVRVTLPKTA